MTRRHLLGGMMLLASAIHGQPVIADYGVGNAASYAYFGAANNGIAQGSIFVIFGTGLGPASLVQALSFPIPTELSGTIVELASGGALPSAPVIYTSAGQVAAIAPSNTPVGSGSIRVAYNGAVSAPQPIEIVGNRFGIFTTNQAGTGRGAITDLNFQAFDLQTSALAGDIAIIWAPVWDP